MLDGVTVPRRHRPHRLGGDRAARACGRRARKSPARWPMTALTEADLAAGRYDAATIETVPGRLERAVAARAAQQGRARRGAARGPGVHRRNARPGRSAERRKAAGSTPRPARPISATAAAPSISTDPAFRGSGAVSSLSGTSSFSRSGLDGFADGWFTAGRLTLTERRQRRPCHRGEKPSRRRRWRRRSMLWQAMPEPIAVGDTFTVTAGCDKRFATCRDRFDNA